MSPETNAGATLCGIRRAIEHAVSARRVSADEYARQMAAYRQRSEELEAIVRDCKALLQRVTA
jgi:hypothetical protein